MSKFLVNLALLNTKALVNAYTWTTLPFYAAAQRPWQRLNRAKGFGVTVTVDKHGRKIYSRPKDHFSKYPHYKYSTFPEAFAHLDRNRPAIGIREVLSEKVATDENGNPIVIEGKELKKVELAKDYRWMSTGEVLDKVDALARGLKDLGVQKGDKVVIYAENGIDWFLTCLALAKLNAITVTLFSTLGDSGVVYGYNNSDAKYTICSEDLLPKLNKLSDKFDHLKKIVYIRNVKTANTDQLVDQLKQKNFDVLPFDQVEANGAKMPPCEFPLPNPEQIAVIMYTSGTTGDPKGVLIGHRQLNASIKNLMRMDEEIGYLAFSNVTYASYLPQAHLFGFLMNIATFCAPEPKIAFCSPFTLLDSSPAHVKGQVGDLKLIAPEFFIAVPLVLERVLKEIYRKLNAQSPLAVPLFKYLMDYKIRWTQRGFTTPLINKFICTKINEQFGGKLKLIGVSSAPLHESTHAMIQAALNVKVINAYGATETCGGSHMLHIDDLAYGTVGVPYSSTKYYLKNWDDGGYTTEDKPNPRGEIMLGGDTIAQGYYKMDEENRKAFKVDEEGNVWYSSGDIGEILPNGTLKIIDRKKDLTKLANGEFVSLGKIESGLRSCELVENVCVCTDPYSNHVTALISPNRRALNELAAEMNKTELTFGQLCQDQEVVGRVFKSIKSICKQHGFKLREVPVQIRLVSTEWTVDNGLLTAAFKLKRKQVTDFYATEIREMFELANSSGTKSKTACKIAAAVRNGTSPPPVDQGISVS